MKKKIFASLILIFMTLALLQGSDIVQPPAEEIKLITIKEIEAKALDADVETILSSMTIEQKVGQMFMGCFYSKTPSAKTVEKYHLGSVLLFTPSFQNTDKKEVASQLAAIDSGCSITPIIAVDEEGGSVVRVSADPKFRKLPFSSPRWLYDKGGVDEIIKQTHEKNKLLLSLGIDMNLAPVCDISTDPKDFIYPRSLGKNAQTTSIFAEQTVRACIEDGIACSLKHFPGYGSAVDTHKGIAVDNRSLETLQSNDLLPFKAGIDAGAHSVLISHNIVSAIDGNLPASLSPAAHRMLREKLRYDGIIITDDLSMGTIKQFLPDEDSAVAAVLAGNDILCTGDYKAQYAAVLQAVKSGQITEKRIDESVRRILSLKLQIGVINPAV